MWLTWFLWIVIVLHALQAFACLDDMWGFRPRFGQTMVLGLHVALVSWAIVLLVLR